MVATPDFCKPIHVIFRSSHRRFSLKKVVLKNFAKVTGKQLCQSLFFNKVVGFRPATLFKKRLCHSCVPVNFAKFLRTPFYRAPPATTSDYSSITCSNLENDTVSLTFVKPKYFYFFIEIF